MKIICIVNRLEIMIYDNQNSQTVEILSNDIGVNYEYIQPPNAVTMIKKIMIKHIKKHGK